MANKKPMTPHMRLSEIANQAARYADNVIAEAYDLGYQAAEKFAPVPVEPRADDKCTCYRSMTTGKFEDGHQYPCQGGEQ